MNAARRPAKYESNRPRSDTGTWLMSFSLFDTDEPMPLAARLAPTLRSLAERGVFFGTSSWKYEGWLGSIYRKDRYITRGKFSRKKFEAECLREYAETFPAAGGDFSFYQFPSPDFWAGLFGSVPANFRFGLKVPEQITVPRWPGHARYGARAGQPNEYFLDANLFSAAFAGPLAEHREHVGVMMFEFGTFSKGEMPDVTAFIERLEPFLQALPPGWRYGIEIRNKEYLTSEYFSLLARYNVAHVFNAWTRMPSLAEQIAMPEAFTADFTVVRALLQKGRGYEDAVQKFEPYREVQQPDESTREALRSLKDRALQLCQTALVFVNNRLEGNAPGTIDAVVSPDRS